ncbi:MAG: hypothetical protein QOE19_2704 [Actinomycetota bacterium]|nr:hypothetical protein [Actinomycetota bacterium]
MPATALTNDELEGRLCLLAGQIAAWECEFLLLLAEYDAREGWGQWGMRSAAHWLSTRCGMRLGTARERVRVGRALTLLPRVRDAFAGGRLSYCKVRALTRVATPATEEYLVDIALGATGSQLESVVRSWRTVLSEDLAAARHARRGVKRREDADGSVVYVVRVAPEEAAVVDAALRAARAAVVGDDGRPVEVPEEARLAEELCGDPPEARTAADAFVLMAEGFLATGPVTEKPDVYQVVIHADVDALVDLPGMSRGDVPARHDASDRDRDSAAGRSATDRHTVDDRRGGPVHEHARRLGPPGCVVENGPEVSTATVMRLLCQSAASVMLRKPDGQPYDLGRSVRHASRKQRRALQLRDAGCRFPSCTRRTHLIPHHVRWWSQGGATDLDNLVLLCAAHHRAVHELGYSIAVLGTGRFLFFRPDGRHVAEPGDVPAARAPDAHRNVTEADEGVFPFGRSPDVDETQLVPMWGGERLDLRLLIGALANNVLIDGGYDLLSTPSRDLPAAIRAAAEWPLEVERRRPSAAAA